MTIPITFAVTMAVVLLLFLWGVITSYSLIATRNQVKQCRSAVCVVLMQRNNLIYISVTIS